jgi:hypothetical protein
MHNDLRKRYSPAVDVGCIYHQPRHCALNVFVSACHSANNVRLDFKDYRRVVSSQKINVNIGHCRFAQQQDQAFEYMLAQQARNFIDRNFLMTIVEAELSLDAKAG